MKQKKVRVRLEKGLHARPATDFVNTATGFESEIELGKGDRFVNAKSIMGVISQEVVQGTEVILKVQGPDEEKALTFLERFLTEGGR